MVEGICTSVLVNKVRVEREALNGVAKTRGQSAEQDNNQTNQQNIIEI